jgi:hypothetical protein
LSELQRADWTGKALLDLESGGFVMRSQRPKRWFPTAHGRTWAAGADVFAGGAA